MTKCRGGWKPFFLPFFHRAIRRNEARMRWSICQFGWEEEIMLLKRDSNWVANLSLTTKLLLLLYWQMTIILHHEKLRALWASILREQYCSFFHANSMPTLSLQETGNRFCVTSPWKKCVSVEKVIFTVLPDLQLMAHWLEIRDLGLHDMKWDCIRLANKD